MSQRNILGMELIDNRLRRWMVKTLLLEKPLPEKRWWRLLPPAAEFDLELEAMPPITLEELKARLIAEWDAEFEEDIEVIRVAPDLATMLEQTNTKRADCFGKSQRTNVPILFLTWPIDFAIVPGAVDTARVTRLRTDKSNRDPARVVSLS